MSVLLCRTCRHARSNNAGYTEFNGKEVKRRIGKYYCREFYFDIEHEATECSGYDDKRVPDIRTLEKMAYIMEKKVRIGFENPIFEFIKPKES